MGGHADALMFYDAKKIISGAVKNARATFTDETPLSRARLEICADCPFATRKGKCEKCGCPIFKKTKLAGETCPLGKW